MGLIDTVENLLRAKGHPGVAGIWEDEHKFVEAARKTHEAGHKNIEAISPYPLHGIDDAIGIPRSFIPYITAAFGTLGCLFGIWFTHWTSAHSYALNVGGKPLYSTAAFIPVIFECTILLSALSSVGAMIVINGLPKVDPPTIDPDLTSHKFALWIPTSSSDAATVKSLFQSLGASDVKEAEF